MDQQTVRQKMEQFFLHLREEQEIRDELGALEFQGVTESECKRAMERQRELLEGLDGLRKQKMLPLLTQVAEYVASRKEALERPAVGKVQPRAARVGTVSKGRAS